MKLSELVCIYSIISNKSIVGRFKKLHAGFLKKHHPKEEAEIELDVEDEVEVIKLCCFCLAKRQYINTANIRMLLVIINNIVSPECSFSSQPVPDEHFRPIAAMYNNYLLNGENWKILKNNNGLIAAVVYLDQKRLGLLNQENFTRISRHVKPEEILAESKSILLAYNTVFLTQRQLNFENFKPNEINNFRSFVNTIEKSSLLPEERKALYDRFCQLITDAQRCDLANICFILQENKFLVSENIPCLLVFEPDSLRKAEMDLASLHKAKLLNQTLITLLNKSLQEFSVMATLVLKVFAINGTNTFNTPAFTDECIKKILEHNKFDKLKEALSLLARYRLLTQRMFNLLLKSRNPYRMAYEYLAAHFVDTPSAYARYYLHEFSPLDADLLLNNELLKCLDDVQYNGSPEFFELLMVLHANHLLNKTNIDLFSRAANRKNVLLILQVFHYAKELTQERFNEIVSCDLTKEVCQIELIAFAETGIIDLKHVEKSVTIPSSPQVLPEMPPEAREPGRERSIPATTIIFRPEHTELLASASNQRQASLLLLNLCYASMIDPMSASLCNKCFVSKYSLTGQLLEQAKLFDEYCTSISQKAMPDCFSRFTVLLAKNNLLSSANLDIFLDFPDQRKLVCLLEILHGHKLLDQDNFIKAVKITSFAVVLLMIALSSECKITKDIAHNLYESLKKVEFALSDEDYFNQLIENQQQNTTEKLQNVVNYLESKVPRVRDANKLPLIGLFGRRLGEETPSIKVENTTPGPG